MEYKTIRTPLELLKFMSNEIKYGFVDNSGNIYDNPGSDEWKQNWHDNGIVQNYESILNTKIGTCWDQVELERNWFSSNNYDFKTYFMFFENEKTLPTHTMLIYKENDKYYWFENSFEKERGIHEFNSFNELMNNVIDKQFKYAYEERGASLEDKEDIRYFEFTIPNENIKISDYLDLMFDTYYHKKEK